MDHDTPDVLCSACLSFDLGWQLTSLGCVIPPAHANHRGATRGAGCSWCVEIAQPVPIVLKKNAKDLSCRGSLCTTLLNTEHPFL
jgi:hypothetical protein